MLVTSREPLGVRGEIVYPVHPLQVGAPDRPASLLLKRCFWIALPVSARVSMCRGRRWQLSCSICAQLDGLPLAIELASTWTRTLAPSAMMGMLNRQLDSFKSGRRDAEERHRTMRAAIAWSYDLLELDEQQFFRAMASFNGAFEARAAAAVAAGDETHQSGSAELLPDVLMTLNDIATLTSKNLMRMAPGDGATGSTSCSRRSAPSAGSGYPAWRGRAVPEPACRLLLVAGRVLGPDLAGPRRRETLEQFDREYANMRACLQLADRVRALEEALRSSPSSGNAGSLVGCSAKGGLV